MSLTRVEKERINDSRMRIQTASTTLKEVDPKKVPELAEIRECLDNAERTLDSALRQS